MFVVYGWHGHRLKGFWHCYYLGPDLLKAEIIASWLKAHGVKVTAHGILYPKPLCKLTVQMVEQAERSVRKARKAHGN